MGRAALPVRFSAGQREGWTETEGSFPSLRLDDLTGTVSSFYDWRSEALEGKAALGKGEAFHTSAAPAPLSPGFAGQCQVDYYSFLQWERGRHFLLQKEIFFKSEEMKRI